MREYLQETYAGERCCYGIRDAKLVDCVFEAGESPLKECLDLELVNTMFMWKYPLWYCENVVAKDCTWFEMARAGVWYTNHIVVENALIQAPKNFRRCEDLTLRNVTFPNAAETLWSCKDVVLDHVTAKGDYFAMNSENLEIDGLVLDGNYGFDGVKNIVIRNSKLLTKDAFWNCENVTVYDSFISGEYLGWNSKNLKFVNCTIESNQGMCYIDDLVMENCKLIHTTLAFEYSSVDATVPSKIDSVFNPKSGKIVANEIADLIVETDKVDEKATEIVCDKIGVRHARPEWLREQ
ncbi:MAG: DUF3737 family protein [Lachnospiraceae bacterium]|nr:DUF3737 family protein [Lachnospiraceae bacterium]